MARKVDELLDDLPPSQKQEFLRRCHERAYATDLYRLLTDWGCQVSYQTVCNWYADFFPVGSEVKAMQMKTQAYLGGNTLTLEEYSVARLFTLIDKMLDRMDNFEIDNDAIFDRMPNYLQQWRGIIASLRQAKEKLESREVALTVSEEVIAEFLLTFQNTPLEAALQEAARGARRKVKERWG